MSERKELLSRSVSVSRTVRFGRGPWQALPAQTMPAAVAIEVWPHLVPEIVQAARGEGGRFKALPGERIAVRLSQPPTLRASAT